MADGTAPMLRSGLCHGPGCQEKITDRSPSQDFCSDGCQACWSAAHIIGTAPDRGVRPSQGVGEPGYRRLALGHLRTGDMVMLGADRQLYHVTSADESHASLTPAKLTRDGSVHLLPDGETPCDCFPNQDPPKPVRRAWWKPSTWRRT